MISVSSACIKSETIKGSLENLVTHGIKNIELSGGTNYYDEIEYDILALKEKYDLNLSLHNYFPPPQVPFVLNLASLNNDIYKKSIELCKKAINLSKKIGSKVYSVHAGSLIDFSRHEIGKKIQHQISNDKKKAIKRFSDAFKVLIEEAGYNISIYIENNVLSSTNARTYEESNPFFLTDYESYLELKDHLDFDLLLDVAHLNVSANSLDLDIDDQFQKLLGHSDYIHISENDGLHDQNKPININSTILKKFCMYNIKYKYITLEVYDEIDKIVSSYELIRNVVGNQNKMERMDK